MKTVSTFGISMRDMCFGSMFMATIITITPYGV
jgi:hypothetical protein